MTQTSGDAIMHSLCRRALSGMGLLSRELLCDRIAKPPISDPRPTGSNALLFPQSFYNTLEQLAHGPIEVCVDTNQSDARETDHAVVS